MGPWQVQPSFSVHPPFPLPLPVYCLSVLVSIFSLSTRVCSFLLNLFFRMCFLSFFLSFARVFGLSSPRFPVSLCMNLVDLNISVGWFFRACQRDAKGVTFSRLRIQELSSPLVQHFATTMAA